MMSDFREFLLAVLAGAASLRANYATDNLRDKGTQWVDLSTQGPLQQRHWMHGLLPRLPVVITTATTGFTGSYLDFLPPPPL
jgi:hypothetical protein